MPPNRIEALADGIFAVAMTILVLELHVPDLGPVASEAGLLAALRSLEPKVFSFGSGFVILGTLWIGHRFQFHYIRRSNRAILWINLAFLLTISFLPFVVALIGTYGPMRVTCVLYGATLVAALACLLVQWLYATGPSRRLVGHTVAAGGLSRTPQSRADGHGRVWRRPSSRVRRATRQPDLLRGDAAAVPAAGPF